MRHGKGHQGSRLSEKSLSEKHQAHFREDGSVTGKTQKVGVLIIVMTIILVPDLSSDGL